MQIIYDPQSDTMNLELKKGKVSESDEEKEGFIFDYNSKGELLSIEILDASKRIPNHLDMRFSVLNSQ